MEKENSIHNPTTTTAMASLPLLAALFFLPLFLVLLTLKRASSSKKTALPPSPQKLPFIGNLHQLGALAHRSLHSLAQKHGPLMLLQLGQVPTLVVSSAEMAREVMKTNDLIFASRPTFKSPSILFYDNLDMAFAKYGEHWRQMRKISMAHLFSMKRVQSYRAAREEEVAHLIQKITASAMEPLNMSEVLYFFANDVLCRVILGKQAREEGRNKIFHEMIEENVVLLSCFNVEDYFPSLKWLSPYLGLDERAKRNSRRWDGVLQKLVEDHEESRKEEGEEIDFVDVLLELQKDPDMTYDFTKRHIKALLLDMFAAGTDTSYIVLEWTMAELVKSGEALKKLQEEVRGAIGEKSFVAEADVAGMNYLKAVVKEALRLHPPGPLLVPRETMDSCQIEGYEIPKELRVIVNAWGIARDPRYFEEPDAFRPERFLGTTTDFRGHDYQYIPFGAGRRMCPGMQLAVPSLELAVANLVHRFDWGLPDGKAAKNLDMTEMPGLTIRMKNSLYLVPKPRF